MKHSKSTSKQSDTSSSSFSWGVAAMAFASILITTTSAASTTTRMGTTRIAGYQTKSTVTGSFIDLDQAEMERHLNAGDFEKAKQIYKQGAHMGPYANLHLESPIPQEYRFGEDDNDSIQVLGLTGNGDTPVFASLARGTTLYKGQTYLSVNYQVTIDQYQQKQIPCAVGGRENPNMDGCLAAKGGLILEGYGAVNYYYDPSQDNSFWGSLYGFSEHEAEKMFHCKDKCPYPEYEKYYHYYGQLDYGDLWIEAALDGTETGFTSGAHFTHGAENFGYLNAAGRAEAVKTATVTMNVFTQVNRIMTEWSIDKCHAQCDNGPCPQAAEPWDTAVATYAGSLEGPDGNGQGFLLYSLADQLCTDFATCGKDKLEMEGTSNVNMQIIAQFQNGRSHLEAGKCENAKQVKTKVNQLMTIPLIQATLRSAYRLQSTHNPHDDEERGRAAAFVAAVLPDVYACSHTDASIIYQNMKLSNTGSPNFAEVKAALERNYDCMNVQCDDIGGLYDLTTGKYHKGAEPCGHRRASVKKKPSTSSSSITNKGTMTFLLCNLVVLVALIVKRKHWVPILSSQIDSVWSRQFSNDSSERSYALVSRDHASMYEPVLSAGTEQQQGQFNNTDAYCCVDGSERSHASVASITDGGDYSERSHIGVVVGGGQQQV